jgi:hypothetical protein
MMASRLIRNQYSVGNWTGGDACPSPNTTAWNFTTLNNQRQ